MAKKTGGKTRKPRSSRRLDSVDEGAKPEKTSENGSGESSTDEKDYASTNTNDEGVEPRPEAARYDIRGLRKKLGDLFDSKEKDGLIPLSYVVSYVGASRQTVDEWESGEKTPRMAKHIEKLEELIKKAEASDKGGLPEPKKRGRKAGQTPDEGRSAKPSSSRSIERGARPTVLPSSGATNNDINVVTKLLNLALEADNPKPLITTALNMLRGR